MRIFCYLLIFGVVSSTKIKAATVFTIKPERNFASREGAIKFIAELSGKSGSEIFENYKIRPVLEKGAAAMKKTSDEMWVSNGSPWSEMPYFTENLNILLDNRQAGAIEIFFQIQDTKRGRVYETNKIQIWTGREINGYNYKLNEMLAKWRDDSL